MQARARRHKEVHDVQHAYAEHDHRRDAMNAAAQIDQRLTERARRDHQASGYLSAKPE